ncbi:hypothetical protein CALCODRAFT_187291 [Calocera cornea HHB12733]|uniref:Uncharacterized protein n=1 Tax=Calocera cornea HHB12733 TaxID=1353952 RepID=A0A165HPR4_9BASI|nr:hypothetical protein CALCODRAFT_187291 [Calocera cornea HHB12733]
MPGAKLDHIPRSKDVTIGKRTALREPDTHRCPTGRRLQANALTNAYSSLFPTTSGNISLTLNSANTSTPYNKPQLTMPLISLLRSLSFRRLPALDGPDSSSDPSQRSTSRRSKREQSRERRASVLQECLTRSIDPILLPLPEGGETHRRAERRVRARHISFDATTEAHQRYKSLGFPRIPTYSVELERREYVPYPAHWSRSYHAMYEGAEGPIIQDAMYMSLLHVVSRLSPWRASIYAGN